LRFRDDGEYFNGRTWDVIENPDFANAEPVPRTGQTPEALNSAPAGLRRFVTEMTLESISDLGTKVGLEKS
jgi:hypothetical protein